MDQGGAEEHMALGGDARASRSRPPGVAEPPARGWADLPAEVLEAIAVLCPVKERCKVLGAVCRSWRAANARVPLAEAFDVARVPLLAGSEENFYALAGMTGQNDAFSQWLNGTGAPPMPLLRATGGVGSRPEFVEWLLRLRRGGPTSGLLSAQLVIGASDEDVEAFDRLVVPHCQSLRCLHLRLEDGEMPRELADLPALVKLWIDCCDLGLENASALRGLTRLTSLEVSGAAWETLPAGLTALPLSRLVLRHCEFSGEGAAAGAPPAWLPADLGCLPASLRELALPACRICAVPAALAALTSLTSLDLSRGLFTELPAEMGPALARLQVLNLDGCANLRALPAFVALRELNVWLTEVRALPADAPFLTTLEKLTWSVLPPTGAAAPDLAALISAGAPALNVFRWQAPVGDAVFERGLAALAALAGLRWRARPAAAAAAASGYAAGGMLLAAAGRDAALRTARVWMRDQVIVDEVPAGGG